MSQIPRNSPCPCGSGKKYKKCCFLSDQSAFSVKPANPPEVIDYHLISRDGKSWERQPGTLMATIYVKDSDDVNEEIEKTMLGFFDLAKGQQDTTSKLHDCKHKLYAAAYHLRTIDREIEKSVDDFKKSYSAGSGVSQVKENQVLIYETEAFLFQVKSSLDLATQLLGGFYPVLRSFRSFAHKGSDKQFRTGGKIIDTLQKMGEKDLAQLIEAHRVSWIQEMVVWRDTITHYSGLKDFQCFLEEPYKGKEVQIHYPTMPNKQRVDAFCRNTFEALLRFYAEIQTQIKSKK